MVALVAVCLAAVGCATSNSAPTPSQLTSQSGGTSNMNAPVVDTLEPTEEELWAHFLDSDFTVIAGTWENDFGDRLIIPPDGIMGGAYTLSNGMAAIPVIANPSKESPILTPEMEGAYFAVYASRYTDQQDIESVGSEYSGGVGIVLFPTGMEIIVNDTQDASGKPVTVESDESQIRMVLTQNTLDGWLYEHPEQIYYRVSDDYEIVGTWECIAESDSADKFVYQLTISGSGDVFFTAGWYESEIAGTFAGPFTVEDGNILKLKMTNVDDPSEAINSTFSFEASDSRLTLTLKEGDTLTTLFGIGDPMEFTRVQ